MQPSATNDDKLIDGRRLAAESRQRTADRVASLGVPVKLAAILCGDPGGAAVYADRQAQSCRDVGIDYVLRRLPEDASFDRIATEIVRLNNDPTVTGVMVHLPLPGGIDPTPLQSLIALHKDVEGVSPANIGRVVYGRTLLAPCTARAAVELIESTDVPIEGAEAVVVGASEIAGKPMALLLTQRKATVTICQKETRDLVAHTSRADILVVAVGRPNLIGPDHVKHGAVVIDVGINRVTSFDGKRSTVGDVDFDRVLTKAGRITPVPGGVGPMTVAMLLANTARAAEVQAERQ
ncbi:MAG: bifunctional 5,10-methylenetetrahydrofolate dehydrogenase/5,10-methenyltetrahydrofolate cyclohydrolase [Planctomycetota bacterium]